MPSNIEIKARARDFAALEQRVAARSGQTPETLEQEDVFFSSDSGRLKLRILSVERGELILYQRSDIPGPKMSRYVLAPTSAPQALHEILSQVLPQLAVVKKRRAVYRIGQARVHLDQVEGLGEFIELEVVLRPDQSESDGVRVARELMRELAIDESQLIASAYVDLALASGKVSD